MQRRNGDTDVENGLDTLGEGESRTNGESSINIYTLSMDKMDSWGKVAMLHREPSLVLSDDLEGWDGKDEGG